MRAAVLDGPRTALRLETILKPEPKAGEVLLQVRACGVCATDLHVIQGVAQSRFAWSVGVSGTSRQVQRR